MGQFTYITPGRWPLGFLRPSQPNPESTILAVRKNLFDILSPIQHAHDLGAFIHDPIENHVRTGCK